MFEGIRNKNGRRITGSQLTKEEKKRRVVLKRVNLDGSVLRSNFLKAGTMARVGVATYGNKAVCACCLNVRSALWPSLTDNRWSLDGVLQCASSVPRSSQHAAAR